MSARMNRRHKAVLGLAVAIAGIALTDGAKLTQALGIVLVGASLAWLVGSQFVLVCALFIWKHLLNVGRSIWNRVLDAAPFVWKHRTWFAIIAILGIAGVYGWIKYNAYKAEKQVKAALGADAAYQAKMKPIWDCESRNSQFSNADTECEKDPSVVLAAPRDEIGGIIVGPGPIDGIPVLSKQDAPLTSTVTAKDVPIPSRSSTRRVKALYDTELTTTEFGSLNCGSIRAGEIAVLLADNGSEVKIQTADGKVGWAGGGFFEIVAKKIDYSKYGAVPAGDSSH